MEKITFGQLLQAKCIGRKGFAQGGNKMVAPTMFLQGEREQFLREKCTNTNFAIVICNQKLVAWDTCN
jgi:hypothetical protein